MCGSPQLSMDIQNSIYEFPQSKLWKYNCGYPQIHSWKSTILDNYGYLQLQLWISTIGFRDLYNLNCGYPQMYYEDPRVRHERLSGCPGQLPLSPGQVAIKNHHPVAKSFFH